MKALAPEHLPKLELEADTSGGDSSFFLESMPGSATTQPMEPSSYEVGPAALEALASAPIALFAFNPETGRVLFWNDELARLTGYTAHEMLADPEPLATLVPDAAYRSRKTAACGLRGTRFRELEWTLATKFGTRCRVAFSSIDGMHSGTGRPERWVVGVDVTRRAESDRLLRARDKLLRSVFRHLPDMVWLKDGEGRWLLSNPAARAAYGLDEATAYGTSNLALAEYGHSAAAQLREAALSEEATWQAGHTTHSEDLVDDGHGGQRICDTVRVPAFGQRGQRLHMLVVRRDITDLRHAATKLELAGRVLDQSSDGILIVDAQHQVIMVNGAFQGITGYSADEVMGREPPLFEASQHEEGFHDTVWGTLTHQGRWSGEVWNRHKDGSVYPQWLSLSALRNRNNGEITHYVAALSDLSSTRAAEERIAYLSTQDVVTGLPNRAHAVSQANLALGLARRAGTDAALFVIDVDNFKTLNDSLGHGAGDQLLREVGLRLAGAAGAQAVVARLSGDEFLVLATEPQGTTGAAHRAMALMAAVAQPLEIGGMPVSVSISAGVAMFPADGDAFDSLFGRADAALNAAKRAGRAGYQFASASMNQAALERLRLESALRAALGTPALRLEYQPLVHLGSGRTAGVEALCRWDYGDRGTVPPGTFIPIAEESGLIESLGGWVLRSACQQLRAWHDAGHTELFVAVNLSARQLHRGVAVAQVEAALAASGIPPDKLELELTESVLLHDGEAVMSTLQQLRALGVKLSIDDFGTGYSSFAYLRRFKFNKIKIDQSFVRDLIDDPDNAAIVRGIISLALNLGLDVLAEGVETEAVAQRLRRLQCTFAQGYFFARPTRPELLALSPPR